MDPSTPGVYTYDTTRSHPAARPIAPAGPGTGYGFHHEGYAGGYCPPEYGHGCPPGNCQQHFMPRHVQSYSYDRPSDLVYPQPNSTRSEEHPTELQSLMRISYAVFGLKNTTNNTARATIYPTD